MIFIVHPDRTVTTIAETLHVGDTSADVTVLSPFSGVQNCMLKFLLPTGEEGTPQFLNYYGDGTDLGLGYEGSVYTMKIPAVMTKVAGTVQVQIIFTDTGAQQFVSETATFTVSGIEVLPFPDSEEQGEDFAAQLLAMQATLAVAMEAAKVGGTVCKFTTLSSNTTITLQNLVGMTSIDWGDGTVDNALSHTYAEAGTYTCYIAGLTDIGANAFANITVLKDIVIGDGVKSIGVGAFQACTGLISASIGNGVTSIGSSAFVSCAGLRRITIPDSVSIIGEAAFSACTGLKSIVIGGGVIIIGALAFASCSSLVQIVFNGTTPPAMNNANALGGTNNCPIFVPYKCLAAYQTAYADYASRIVVTDTQPLTGADDPTTSTATEYVGKVYINTTTGAAFVCTAINSGVYTWQQIGAPVTIDAALSGTSENPVQNKVITDALGGKQDTLTFDDAPTAGSNNPVKSGGIKTALDGKVDENSPITGATKAKITYDEKGLVTGGADLSASDIPALTLAKITDAGAAASKGVATNISGSSTDADLATAKAVHDAINALPEPMIFMGSLGVGGTYAFLPAASESEGYTYKVITAGTYAGISAQVGDTFISNGTEWVLIPSGDEPSGTVTSVGVSVPTGLTVSGSPVTSSGTIAIGLASGYSIPTDTKQSEWDGKQDALTFDNAPTANSDNPVKSGGIKDALDAKQDTLTAGTGIDITNGVISATASVTVDSALSDSSENPVQNKVVTKALRGATICKFVTTAANTAITLQNLTGMTSIDWGDGTVDSNLTHTYAEAGTYYSYIYGMTAIGTEAFIGIVYLKGIIISDEVTSIANYAFKNCSGLAYCKLSNQVKFLNAQVFYGTGITSIQIPDSVTNISSAAFRGSSIKDIYIPVGVSQLSNDCFRDCSGLKKITIASDSASISQGAFNNCTALEKIIFECDTPPTLNTSGIFDSTNNCPIYVPRAALATYKAATNYTTYASRIVANATTDDLAAKQDTLTAGTGIDITGNVISVTGGGGGGSSWTEIDGGANTQIASYAFSVNKKYEIFAMAYHPMFYDLTPMSTPPFVLDTDSSIMAVNLYVNPAFQTGATGDQQLEVAPDLGQWSPIYFQWVLASDKSASGWKIKVYYRELDVAT